MATDDGRIYIVGLADRVREAGLTQQELADQLGFTREFVNGLCCGRKEASVSTLLSLATFFGHLMVRKADRVFTVTPIGSLNPAGTEDPSVALAHAVPSAGVEGVALQMLRERDLEEAELHQVHALVEELHSGRGRRHLVQLGVLAWRRRVWAHKVHEAIEQHAPGCVAESLRTLVRDMAGRGYTVEGVA